MDYGSKPNQNQDYQILYNGDQRKVKNLKSEIESHTNKFFAGLKSWRISHLKDLI